MQNENCNNVTTGPAVEVTATTTPSEALAREPGTVESVPLQAETPIGATLASPPDPQSPPLRILTKPKFVARHVYLRRQADPPPPVEPEIPADTVLLAYEFVLQGGHEEVLRVKSQLVLPLALAMENLAQTDVHFPELVDRVIVQPTVTKFRGFLLKRFEAASRAAIEPQTTVTEPFRSQPPAPAGIGSPKPTNGAGFAMPELDAKPPISRMPGGPLRSGAKNGA